MKALAEHLDAINKLLSDLHDGFYVESYDGNNERLVILGSRDISYYRDLLITCTGAVDLRFVPTFHADEVRLSKHKSGQDVLEFLDDGHVTLSVRGGIFEFDCVHI